MPGVLLFGGSFDPIHHGHLITCRAAAERLGVERVILLPSARPPHKLDKRLSPAADRIAMCQLAVDGDALFEVSDWEMRQTEPSYTLHTVRHFKETLGERTPLYWLLGMDSLADLHSWYCVDELASTCVLATVGRPGVAPDWDRLRACLSAENVERLRAHVLATPLVDISATDIRGRVRAGRGVRYLVPERVREYIDERRLYAV